MVSLCKRGKCIIVRTKSEANAGDTERDHRLYVDLSKNARFYTSEIMLAIEYLHRRGELEVFLFWSDWKTGSASLMAQYHKAVPAPNTANTSFGGRKHSPLHKQLRPS